ncbi:SIMPL domain-containing protein [Aquimarina megaterium]|uniref:SIMPL domain-containing protein n=1 Tax=Aquimarina megaterium TaxID=1443666 RepID=UPI00047075C1|nr:SIMPL domain-containing protein [Aquimarina megaterium]
MKKLVFIVLLLTVTSVISQENNTTLTIVGEAKKQIEIDSYSLTISLRQIVANGNLNFELASLSQITQNYKDKLKTIGVDFSKFQKNVLLQLYTSYSEAHDVSYYNYATTSEEEMIKIIKQKMNGLTIVQVEAVAKEKNNTEWSALTLAAIEDAKVKAKKTADHLNKKLGRIVKVENSDSRTQYINMYKPEEIQKHLVTVTFTLE